MGVKSCKSWIDAMAKKRSDSVYRIIDVGDKSWEDAGRMAVETAAGSLRDLRIAEVTKMDMKVEDGKVTCLLLQRLAQFVEQPRVLNGDGCLVSKGTDQIDLPLRKWLNTTAPKGNDADWLAVM
jgi:dodecin